VELHALIIKKVVTVFFCVLHQVASKHVISVGNNLDRWKGFLSRQVTGCRLVDKDSRSDVDGFLAC